MDTNKMREQFKSALHSQKEFKLTAEAIAAAEWAWKASREAVVVELPPKWCDATHSNKQAWDCGIDDARMAIEAAGLKVKP